MIQVGAQCPGCLNLLGAGLQDWHRVCRCCSYEGSTLSVEIDTEVRADDDIVDEAMREQGLEHLRQRNFQTLIADLEARVPCSNGLKPRLLDVGCAHGWFLEAGRDRFDGIGIEPDARIAAIAALKGYDVRRGFFPDVLATDERFDVIVFNDVLEHIPDVAAALSACVVHLRPGGWVIVNAPARTGVLYRIARIMLRLGMPGAFNRLWQKGFPSPHVHYFDDASMQAIAERAGLSMSAIRTLPSMSSKGLYARIRTDRNLSLTKAVAMAAVLSVAAPVLRVMPSDIKVWMLQQA